MLNVKGREHSRPFLFERKMMSNTKNIIFDIGYVLIRWNPDRVYDAYFGDKEKVKLFYEETGIFKLNQEIDKGLPFDEALKILAAQFPHYHEPILHWKDKWRDMIEGPVEQSVNVLKRLHQLNYPLFALTNWSAETFPYVLHKYDFFSCFRDIVVSGREKVIKPDFKIYDILLKRNHLQPQHCIFIDDNMDNLHSAKHLGMSTIHFVTSEQLEIDLRALGIIL